MYVHGIQLKALTPPKDSLLAAIEASDMRLKENDIVAISSKVVSIDEGRAVPLKSISKERLTVGEAEWYRVPKKRSKWRRVFTVNGGALVGGAGIDESNGSGHYILYPKDPEKSARRLRRWLMRKYALRSLAVIITDSTSVPFRRGAVGFALSWDGIDPLRDYRGTQDLFGRRIDIEMANLIDQLASAAVLEMGEGAEGTPMAVIRDAKNIVLKNRSSKEEAQLKVAPRNDLFAPILWGKEWKRGKNKSSAPE
jgi:dihydrofolate synthase / folylpolyglutamate synthase